VSWETDELGFPIITSTLDFGSIFGFVGEPGADSAEDANGNDNEIGAEDEDGRKERHIKSYQDSIEEVQERLE